MNGSSNPASPPETSRGRRRLRKIVRALLVLALAVVVFYTEENWRGERAWDKYRRELEAKGEVLDWRAYIPRPVPPDQNFLKVPLMEAWFNRQTRNTNDLQRLDKLVNLEEYRRFAEARHGTNFLIIEVQVWPAAATNVPSPAYPREDFEVDNLDVFRDRLSQAAQAAIVNDARSGPMIIGGGPGRQPRRIHVQLDAKASQQQLETKLNRSFFAVEPTKETNVVRVVCSPGILAEDAVAWFKQFQAEFDALYQACQRPHARLAGSYGAPWSEPIPNFVGWRTIVQALNVRLKANLLVGQPEAALRDAEMLAQLTRYLAECEPTFVGTMMRVAVSGLYVDAIGEGLGEGLWPEQHCAAIQAQLHGMDLLDSFARGMRWERGVATHFLQCSKGGKAARAYAEWCGLAEGAWRNLGYFYFMLCPCGWVCQSTLLICRLHQLTLDGLDPTNQRIDVRQEKLAEATTEREVNRFRPSTRFGTLTFPNFTKAVQIMAKNQVLVHQTLVACALERCRRVTGQYPESLEALAPRFLDKLPHDLFTGQPLKYRRTPDGKFLLYSVGWNQKDDGGTAGPSKLWLRPDLEQGDWVWPHVPKR